MTFEEALVQQVERLEQKLTLLERYHAAASTRADALPLMLLATSAGGGSLVVLAALALLWWRGVLS